MGPPVLLGCKRPRERIDVEPHGRLLWLHAAGSGGVCLCAAAAAAAAAATCAAGAVTAAAGGGEASALWLLQQRVRVLAAAVVLEEQRRVATRDALTCEGEGLHFTKKMYDMVSTKTIT